MIFDELDRSTIKSLKANGIDNIQDLLKFSEVQIGKMQGIGSARVSNIVQTLRLHRLSLRPSISPLKKEEILEMRQMLKRFRVDSGVKFIDDESDRLARELRWDIDRLIQKLDLTLEDFEIWERKLLDFESRSASAHNRRNAK